MEQYYFTKEALGMDNQLIEINSTWLRTKATNTMIIYSIQLSIYIKLSIIKIVDGMDGWDIAHKRSYVINKIKPLKQKAHLHFKIKALPHNHDHIDIQTVL